MPVIAVAIVAIIAWLAALQLRAFNGDVNPDGISYIELAKLFSSGDLAALSNGYWSPLYPILIAIARLVRALTLSGRSAPWSGIVIVRAAVVAMACVWSLIRMIGASTITPDALLAAVLFLATADLVDATISPPTNRRAIAFGVLLGVGYWTKAVFLPVAVVAIVAYVLLGDRLSRRRMLSRTLLGLVMVAGPLVAVQSWSQGRFSFGESGRLNYRWYVGGLDHAPPIHEPIPETRLRQSPSTVAVDAVPGTLLFNGNVGGSFPYWFDPSRFEPAGAGPVSFAAQWRTVRTNALWFLLAAFNLVVLATIAFAMASRRGSPQWRRAVALLPSLALLGLYALTNPNGRMGGAPIACIVAVIVTLGVSETLKVRRGWLVAEYAALGLLGLLLVGRTALRVPSGPKSPQRNPAGLARAIKSNGLNDGSPVGVIGLPFGNYWAHLAGVRFVVVITPSDTNRVLDEAALQSVSRESSDRGQPISAVVWNQGARINSPNARALADGWWIWISDDRRSTLAHRPSVQ
jgi:4-amino-4-deoxy-L-arabinose transferase-like glycosyltransferase